MANLSDKLSSLTFTPAPQSPSKAGFIQSYSGTTAPENWAALSTSVDTTISSAQTLYPQLWENANTAWRSGSDLVVPPFAMGLRNSVPVSDTSYFTVANFGAPTIDGTIWWRDGNRLRAIVVVSTTGAQSGSPYLGLPSGLNVDQTIVLTSRDTLGKYYRVYSQASTSAIAGAGNSGILFWDGISHDRLYISGYSISSGWQKNQPLGTSDEITIEVDVPIAEWATESVEIPIIKLYDDASNIAMSLSDATASLTGAVRLSADFEADGDTFGFVKKNKIIEKLQDTAYASSGATGILPLTNIPDGKYKVTVGCQYAYRSINNAVALVEPQLNGSTIVLGGTTWAIGVDDDGSVETEAYNKGYSGTRIVDFSNGTNTFDLDINVTTDGILGRPWYILEKLENYEEITTEWN